VRGREKNQTFNIEGNAEILRYRQGKKDDEVQKEGLMDRDPLPREKGIS